MNDQQILDYLRSRGRIDPPIDFSRSVMAALDRAPVTESSRFSVYLPAFVAVGAMAAIAILALVLGPARDVGPAPSPSAVASASAEATAPDVFDLRVALLEAVDVLRDAPGVEGLQQTEIDGVLGTATWFTWRPNGDQVVVERRDVDVTETGWWLAPDGTPPATGQRIWTHVNAHVGSETYLTDEAGEWAVMPRLEQSLSMGTAILARSILPWDPLTAFGPSFPESPEQGARVERRDLQDGGIEWLLEFEDAGSPVIQRWTIGPGGELRSWFVQRTDPPVDPEGTYINAVTEASVEFTVTSGDPIQPPDTSRPPGASHVGAPASMPLMPPTGFGEVVRVNSCEHPSGVYRVTLPEGWWTNRNDEVGPDGLWASCTLFGPEAFAPTTIGDETWPRGVAVVITWIDGGCIGSYLALRSSGGAVVDGLEASVHEYARGTEATDPPGLYSYTIDLSEPGVACELGGRFITASTSFEMSGDYEQNKTFLDAIMAAMEITPP